MAHSNPLSRVAPLGALMSALALSGCALIPGPRTLLEGTPERAVPSVTDGARVSSTAPRRTTASPSAGAARPGIASSYEHTPLLAWSRYAVGNPASPALSVFRSLSPSPCAPVPMGVGRVLPVPEGLPARDLHALGPLHVGVAGVPVVTATDLVARGESEFTAGMLDRTSRLGTTGDGCGLNVFAYIRLGLGTPNEPVAVLR